MAFTIDWELDTEEPLVAESLLGRITLHNGEEKIVEGSVYLDSWLETLARAAKESPPTEADGATFEIVEESKPLKVRAWNGGLIVSFRGQDVSSDSQEDFQRAVVRAGTTFLDRTRNLRGASENSRLERLRLLLNEFHLFR
ncbi:MAG: hypothetical protein JNL98_33835 [Bryobacterales bacterium]|nr:hypothetical protein [Bryobacterales bacterium]